MPAPSSTSPAAEEQKCAVWAVWGPTLGCGTQQPEPGVVRHGLAPTHRWSARAGRSRRIERGDAARRTSATVPRRPPRGGRVGCKNTLSTVLDACRRNAGESNGNLEALQFRATNMAARGGIRAPQWARLGVALCVVALIPLAHSDFIYDDFETTTGLIMNGHATTSSCDPNVVLNDVYAYNARHNVSDHSNVRAEDVTYEDGGGGEVSTRSVATNDAATTAEMLKKELAFGHKDEFVAADVGQCAVRARLTPSEASKRGALWHATQVAAPRGFETSFKFQVTDLSRRCTTVRDPTFSTLRFKSCFVSGGDGFAFVLQNDPKGTASLGADGEHVGAKGITNALVVEFDTWYNAAAPASSGSAGGDSTVGVDSAPSHDLFEDHVSIFLTRPLPAGVASEAEYERNTGRRLRVALAPPRRHPISDGRVHTVTIRYYEGVVPSLIGTMTAAPELLPWLVDQGEGRRVGTLAVWVDAHKGGNETATLRERGAPLAGKKPLLAVPINLAAALPMDEGTAWAGFTASTGYAWEKHDILAWYFCEESDCKETRFGRDRHRNATGEMQRDMDYAGADGTPSYVPYDTPTVNTTEGADEQPLSQKP